MSKSSTSLSPQILGEISSSDMTILIIVISLTVLICAIIIFCCCCDKCCKNKHASIDEKEQVGYQTTDQLIPPIFYTDDMQDPLKQEDLHEKIRPSNIP